MTCKASFCRLALGLVFFSAPSHANYDRECIELLSKTPVQFDAFENWRRSWDQALADPLKIRRPISDIEYEAYMDFAHNLPLIAIFANGKKASFRNDAESLKKFSHFLNRTEIVEVRYLPGALTRLGELYKNACHLLGRSGCEIYDSYPGLSGNQGRPFTSLEEQALKWCTFHMASQKTMVAVLKGARRAGSSEEEVADMHRLTEHARRATAWEIVRSVFNVEDVARLSNELVQPYISASFAQTYELYKGKQSH